MNSCLYINKMRASFLSIFSFNCPCRHSLWILHRLCLKITRIKDILFIKWDQPPQKKTHDMKSACLHIIYIDTYIRQMINSSFFLEPTVTAIEKNSKKPSVPLPETQVFEDLKDVGIKCRWGEFFSPGMVALGWGWRV